MSFSHVIRSSYSSLSSFKCYPTRVINQKQQKNLITFSNNRRRKRRSLLSIESILNSSTRSNINDNETSEPSKLLLEKLFDQTQRLDKQTNQNLVYSDEDLQYSEGIESDLEVVLMALLKREEELQVAERKVLYEKKKLNLAKEELEEQERVIFEASLKHETLQEELKLANLELASQGREIDELKVKLKERDEELAIMHSSLSSKELEIDRIRDEITNKSKEVSEFENKSQLLSKANEIVKRQESEIYALQRALKEKEEELEITKATKKLEQEKLKETEANLKKQTEEWLIAQDAVNKLHKVTMKHLGEANETMEDFKRVKKLLNDVRFELVSSREAYVYFKEQMEEKEIQLEKQLEEVEEQRKSVLSYMQSLRDAHSEVESERVKLRVKNIELEKETSIQKKLMNELQEELKKERSLLDQAMYDVSIIQNELSNKTNAFQASQNLLQEKESSLVEAKLEIQHLKSEQASLELLLKERDEELTEARNQLEEVNREVTELKMLMFSKEDQLMQVTSMLNEKDLHLLRIEGELGSSKLRFNEVEMAVEKIADLTNKLVKSTTNDQDQNAIDSVQQPLENKRLVMELNFTKENLQMKETEVKDVQRALMLKDQEISAVMNTLEAKEQELKKLKEETMGDLAIEKLQLEEAQQEVEAATSALQKLVEMSTELLTQADMNIETESISYSDGSNNCVAEVKSEVVRLLSLTEKLLENAGIVADTTVM